MKHLILNYATLHKVRDTSTWQLVKLLVFAFKLTFAVHDPAPDWRFFALLLLLSFLPYVAILRFCKDASLYRIYLTVYFYATIYSYCLSAVLAPFLLWLSPNPVVWWMQILSNPYTLNLALSIGYAIHVWKRGGLARKVYAHDSAQHARADK